MTVDAKESITDTDVFVKKGSQVRDAIKVSVA